MPGIIRSDLLMINKIDLAPYVGASIEVMERDSRKQPGERPFLFTDLRSGAGLDAVIRWLDAQLCAGPRRPLHYERDEHSHGHVD
jgi:urease accessory protein